MRKHKKSTGIFTFIIVAVLAAIIIIGILFLTKNNNLTDSDNKNNGFIDLTGYTNTGNTAIRSASVIFTTDGKIDGYLVTVSSKGYKGDILMDITFDNTGDIIKSIAIKDQNEPEGYGDKIAEESFLSQFNGISAPVSLSGEVTSDPETDDSTAEADTTEAESFETETAETTSSAETTGTIWADGTYETEAAEFDEQGYKDKVTLTIKDSTITEVIWDAYNAAGELKSVLSADGAYMMTDYGPTWQEQAVAIADFVIQNQSADSIIINEEGKTDSVSGVSISVNEFITLIKECLAKAATAEVPSVDNPAVTPADTKTETPETTQTADDTTDGSSQIDGVSGATVSSTAVIDGVNKAQSFIKDFVLSK